MRIDNLWISGHKNFDDFRVNFNEDYLINILLGKNGTGKSNILEVIVKIFQSLDQSGGRKEFFESITYFFEITYYTTENDIQHWFLIKKNKERSFIVYSRSKEGLAKEEEISFAALKRTDINIYLPKYLIGYYSGDSNRLRSIFKKSEDLYYRDVRQNKDQESEFRRFFYSDVHHCQLSLISLLSFANQDERITSLLGDYLDFQEFVDFTITLKSPDWNRGTSLKDGVDKFWGAKGTPLRFCNYLYTESKEEPVIDYNANLNIENRIKESISFILKGEEFVHNASSYFTTGIDLFRHLESTYISGLIHEIVIRVRKKPSSDIIEFSELSEGERQLITIIGLLLFTSSDNTLFLLDEPDTHLNPNWQRDYLTLFNDFSQSSNNHIIIATHSPLLVQSAEDAALILLKLENGKPLSTSDTAFIRNWRIDQVLTSEFFGLKSARPPQLDDYMLIREKILSKSKLDETDLKELSNYENQFGVLPTGETINEFKAQILINKIADKISKNNDSDNKV